MLLHTVNLYLRRNANMTFGTRPFYNFANSEIVYLWRANSNGQQTSPYDGARPTFKYFDNEGATAGCSHPSQSGWLTSGDTHYKNCNHCGQKINSHNRNSSWEWKSDGTNHWKRCKTCGLTWETKAHNYGSWYDDTATCTKGGTHKRKCNTCGYVQTANSSALGHSWSKTWTADNASTHSHRCTRSGCTAKTEITAHKWTYSNWDNQSTHDKTCSDCGYKVTKEAHKFVNNKCECGRYNVVKVSFDLCKPNPEGGLLVDTTPSAINAITYTYADKYYDAKYGLVDPTLPDYNFLGWYTAESGGTKITKDTTVTNANAHTLYAHWEVVDLPITDVEITNAQVIEYANMPEAEYRDIHKPDENIPYSNVTIVGKCNGTIENHYQYKWEYLKEDGSWSEIDFKNASMDKNELTITNVTRDLNDVKLRLTVRSNNGQKVVSEETPITVWYLPNHGRQIYEIMDK